MKMSFLLIVGAAVTVIVIATLIILFLFNK